MVHALKDIWRVLSDEGELIDLRPLCGGLPLQIASDRRVTTVGPVDDAQGMIPDDAAHRAIAAAAAEGWFRKTTQRDFWISYYWDTLDEMQAWIDEHWAPDIVIPPALMESARRVVDAQGGVPRIRLKMMLAAYRKTMPKRQLVSR